MAATGTLTLTGTLVGLLGGSKSPSLSWTITTGVGKIQYDLASGDNTITVPSGTTLILMTPPTGNTQTITQKGNTADTGVQMSKTKPTVWAWQTGATFILTASGTITGFEMSFI